MTIPVALAPFTIQDADDYAGGLLAPSDVGKFMAVVDRNGQLSFALVDAPQTTILQHGMAQVRAIASRIQDAPDGPGTPGSGDITKALMWNNSTGHFVMAGGSGSGLDADTLDGHDTGYFLAADGSVTGATAGPQTFTNGIITGVIKPSSDSVNAMQIQTAGGGQFMVYDTTNRRLNVTDGNTANSALLSTDAIVIQAQDVSPGFSIVSAGSNSANRGVYKCVRARGTLASPTAPSSGDNVFSLLGAVYDGAAVQATSGIEMFVDGAVSSGVAPQRIGFYTSATTGRTERMRIDSAGNVRLGAGTVGARLQIAGGISLSAWGLNGATLRLDAATHTDTSTSASGTVTNAVANAFGRPTFAATNASVTITNAATNYIANSPAAGANVTITNPYALWIDDGNFRLDGHLCLADPSADTNTPSGATAYKLPIYNTTGTLLGYVPIYASAW